MLKNILKLKGVETIQRSKLKMLKGGLGPFGGDDNDGDGTCPEGTYWNDDCRRCDAIQDPYFSDLKRCD